MKPKSILIPSLTLALLGMAAPLLAQERLPREEALHYARIVSTRSTAPNAAGLRVDVDAASPVALRHEDHSSGSQYGALVLPQKGLEAGTIRAAGATPVPVGQLWFHGLAPMRDGWAVPPDRLDMVTVQADGEEVTVPRCTLAVRQDPDGYRLLVFGRGPVPLLVTSLRSIEKQQALPIDLEALREGDGGRLTVRILGRFEATFPVTALEP